MSSRWQKRRKAAITVLFNAFFTSIMLHFGSNVFMVTGAGINLYSLVIKEGKVCWDLYIDGLVISSDGNLLDALGAAIKVGADYIVDATAEEESQMSSAVSISVNRVGHICGLTKRGGSGLDPSAILEMIHEAKHVAETLMNKLDSKISAAKACEDES